MKSECKQHLGESKTQLKNGGLKVTSARLNLLDILKHATKPLSVKEIAESLGGVDLVTLYRNIESLQNLNLVKHIDLKDRQAYFEMAGGSHHHHLICSNCGKLEDVKVKEINLDRAFLKKHSFAKITDHSLEFFGICNVCNKK